MPDDARWLDPLEMRAWRAFLASHSRLLARLDSELQATASLGISDYGVLVTLSDAPDNRLRMSELAERMLLSPSGLTRRVDSLVRTGLVERALCPEDRRGTFAVLTDAGREQLRRVAPHHVRQVRMHFVDLLSRDEITVLATALERVLDHLPADARAADARAAGHTGIEPADRTAADEPAVAAATTLGGQGVQPDPAGV